MVLFTNARAWVLSLVAGDQGQGLLEYTLLVALVAFVAIAAVSNLGETIVTRLYTLANSL